MKIGRQVMDWPKAKIARFVRDWNEGLGRQPLIERYGFQNPDQIARTLRRHGYELADRTKRLQKMAVLNRDTPVPADIPVLPVALNQKRL